MRKIIINDYLHSEVNRNKKLNDKIPKYKFQNIYPVRFLLL